MKKGVQMSDAGRTAQCGKRDAGKRYGITLGNDELRKAERCYKFNMLFCSGEW